jgi:hypothetical protein
MSFTRDSGALAASRDANEGSCGGATLGFVSAGVTEVAGVAGVGRRVELVGVLAGTFMLLQSKSRLHLYYA